MANQGENQGAKPGAETPPADAPQKPKAEAKEGGKGQKPAPAPQKPKAEVPPPVDPVVVRQGLFPEKKARPGLVSLVAVQTCAAHGMMYHQGQRFSAISEVAAKLIKTGKAERV